MNAIAQPARTRLIIYAALLTTLAIYWVGLSGPFLLDDRANLLPLQTWLDGQASAAELIFGNHSGMLGRPVSMATLWASAASGGLHPFPFKLGNLLIHLLTGLVAWQLLRRLLQQDPRLAVHAGAIATVLAAIWLLHPINVSTVLYAVQRMAQLGALFALLSVLTYVVARRHLAEGLVRPACIKLFLLFPLLLLAGLFSKENAAVIPALCAVVELAYFLRQPRPGKALPTFHALFVLLPLLCVVVVLVLEPGRFISYGSRDFTLSERLLSQPRAIMEYLGLLLVPRGGQMGLFVDDFATSTGLFAPATTALALLALLGISGFAIALRKQAPSVFAGWFFFLVAHGVESTILPLELYFEHRNYLPAIGIWLALASLLAWLADKARLSPGTTGRIGWGLSGLAAVVFALVTWQQANVWRSEEAMARQALEHRPTSLRATLALVTAEVQNGRADEARALVQRLVDSPNPRHRLLGYVHATTTDCLRGAGGSLELLRKAETTGVTFLTLADVQAYTQLSRAIGAQRCGPQITDATAADSIVRLLDSTPAQGDGSLAKWQLRSTATSMYMHAGRWQDAQHHAERAWHPGASDTAVGGLLARIQIHNGDKAAAQRTLDQVRAHISPYEVAANRGLANLQSQVDMLPE